MIEPLDNVKAALASMRDELLRDNWAYWHDDTAITWLNELLGCKFPPYSPKGLHD